MKEVTKEFTETKKYTVYQATDGTEFNNIDECRKYEDSALGVLKTKVSKLKVEKEYDAWTLLGGYDDHTIVAFKPQSIEDVDALMQFILLEDPWLKDDKYKGLLEKRYNIINDAYKNKDLILFGINCDDEYYFINSRQNIVNNLMNLDKKEDSNNV